MIVTIYRMSAIHRSALAALGLVLATTLPLSAAEMVGMEHHNQAQGHMQGQKAEAFGKPGDPKKIDRTITLVATEIAFDVKDITVKKGETVRFVLVNQGEQPHELTIADAEEQAAHRQMMASMDMSGMSHHGGNSISAEPGETKELVWTFTKAGKFEFACNYPGHAEVGMEGQLVVK